MWTLTQNNPVMVSIIVVVVIVAVLLHVGIYFVIRRLMRRDVAASSDECDDV